MLTVMQTNFNGIDGLILKELPVPHVTPDGVIIEMVTLPVVPTDWKSETNPQATDEQLAKLPRIIGIGGVGHVVEVGRNRSSELLNKRVFVLNPQGSYSQYLLSENKDFIFTLPDQIDDASAAALTAGPGTAMRLKEEIDRSDAANIVVTGGNSVIGLYLLQMIQSDKRTVWPVVSSASQDYFHEQLPTRAAYTVEQLPKHLENVLIIDIAGSESLLQQLTRQVEITGITSIARQHNEAFKHFKFVHEEFDPKYYQKFVKQLADGTLKAPIGRVFPIEQVKAAQHFAKTSHSRGRVLVTFKQN